MTSESWEEALVEAYAESRWRTIMEPLREVLQRLSSGQTGHAEVDRVLDVAYQEKCALTSLLRLRPDQVAGIIRVSDPEWFMQWIEEHRPPHAAGGW